MTIPTAARSIGVLALAFLVGAGAGAFAWRHFNTEPEDGAGTVTRTEGPLTWDELIGSLPEETTVRDTTATQTECQQVPVSIVRPDRPPPDTVYQARGQAPADLDEPGVTYDDLEELQLRAQSRYPFLYLPLLESGRPAIEHTGRSTTVRAFSGRRGYSFSYVYEPARVYFFAELGGRLAWTAPGTVPRPADLWGQAHADVGVSIRDGWGRTETTLGGALTPAGPAVTVGVKVRSVLHRF